MQQQEEACWDAAGIYAAVKPPLEEGKLQESFPQLRPMLRPYQRRAASWMVRREKGWLVCPCFAGHACCQVPETSRLHTLLQPCCSIEDIVMASSHALHVFAYQ